MKTILNIIRTFSVYIIVRILMFLFMFFYTIGLIIYLLFIRPFIYILNILKS